MKIKTKPSAAFFYHDDCDSNSIRMIVKVDDYYKCKACGEKVKDPFWLMYLTLNSKVSNIPGSPYQFVLQASHKVIY